LLFKPSLYPPGSVAISCEKKQFGENGRKKFGCRHSSNLYKVLAVGYYQTAEGEPYVIVSWGAKFGIDG